MTVKELREALEGVPDDYVAFTHVSCGYGVIEHEEVLDTEQNDSNKEFVIYG